MKKGFLILFSFYFFLTSVGVVFGTHYCGTKLSNTLWNISISGKNACACKHKSDSEHKNKCCKHTEKWMKAKTDESKIQSNFQLNKIAIAFILCSSSYLNFSLAYKTKNTAYSENHSPPLEDTPLFLKNCSLLI
ncbi:MAG: HYC_CC_PP family protein [Bacteroidia bacterium]